MADDHTGGNGNGAGGALLTNVRILDSTGDCPYTGEVLVQGNRIRHITRGGSGFGAPSAAGGASASAGDHGFAGTPQGTNAKDIRTFVKLLGFTPMEAIQAATKYGGHIMNMDSELRTNKDGWLADLILVDGDPLADVRLLQDKNRLLAIMKDGRFHKAPQINEARRRLTA